MIAIFLDHNSFSTLRKSAYNLLSAVTKPEMLEDLMDGFDPSPWKRGLRPYDENLIADDENPYR
ncbi:MAG: hypothetical protein P8P91_13930 [Pseudomonadales bacterium]|nr:hypothetical protein [Pseudomonadales bacterium]